MLSETTSKTYSKRIWLNSEDSRFTGSVVAYYKLLRNINDNEIFENIDTFLEIADCHNKIRLHPHDNDTKQVFVDKMKLLRDELSLFIEFLEQA